jgi:hypothetical protein
MSIPGGWSEYTSSISSEAQAAFDEALKGLVGVNYTPVAVAQQVVAGKNFRFFCNASGVFPNAPNYGAILSISKLIGSPAELTGTETVGND